MMPVRDAARSATNSQPAPAMNRKRILVVDDSPTAIMWQRMILEDEAYDVLTAEDGVEGVRVARESRPDLVLLDVVMPRMNGFDACRAMRADDITRDVPILMVTTRSEMDQVMRGFESGCNEYITKPVDRTELLTKVRSYLDHAEWHS
jgi:DNA-binding response OmpR family regulator